MAEETIYNSIHTGEQIDSAVAWLLKHAQDHICGGAAPGTTIETPSDPTYWFAGAGTYTCGGSETITIPEANIGIISYDGSEWSSNNFNVGSNQAIRNNLLILLDSLGNYCFPDGKPTFDWDDDTPVVIQYDVEKHLTNLTSDAPSKVNYGSKLVIQLTTPSNLYVIDDDTVQVTMGGNVQQGAFDPSTGKITINRVTGKVVIYATGITYVLPTNLAFHLDCKNRGGQTGHWIDLVGNIDFALTNVIESDNGMVFNGSSSKGIAASGSIVAPYDSCTVEVIASVIVPTGGGNRVPILANPLGGNAAAGLGTGKNEASGCVYFTCCSYPYDSVSSPKNTAFYLGDTTVSGVAIASTKNDVLIDGEAQNDPRHHTQDGVQLDFNDYATGVNDILSIGYRLYSAGSPTEYFLNGSIMAIRVYNKKLSVAEMRTNYTIDKKRFNLQ